MAGVKQRIREEANKRGPRDDDGCDPKEWATAMDIRPLLDQFDGNGDGM